MLHTLDPCKPRGLRRLLGARGRCRELYGRNTHPALGSLREETTKTTSQTPNTEGAAEKGCKRVTSPHVISRTHTTIVQSSMSRPALGPGLTHTQHRTKAVVPPHPPWAPGGTVRRRKNAFVLHAQAQRAERRNQRIKNTCTTTKRITGLSACVARASPLVKDRPQKTYILHPPHP